MVSGGNRELVMQAIQHIYNRVRSFVTYNFMLYCNYFVLFVLAFSLSKNEAINNFLPILVAYLLVGIAGFLLNDFWDKEKDQLAGKPNITNHLKPKILIGLIAGILLIGLALLHLVAVSTTVFLSVLISLLILYSTPKIRLKEKGIWGAITDALYAHVIPELILIAYINLYLDFYFFPIFFLLFNFGIGLKDILLHQLEDLENDKLSKVKTLATENISLAKKIVENINWILWPILIAFLVEVYLYSNQIVLLLIPTFVLLTILYNWIKKKNNSNNQPLKIYVICSTLVLIFSAIQTNLGYLVVLLIHPYFLSFFRSSLHAFYLNLIYLLKIIFGRILLTYVPLLVNNILYYGFKIIGRDLKKKPLYSKEFEPKILKKIRKLLR
ncbi:MAG: UbiA family prenyltransferase [Bacteroidia bacterium]|nr:UbiA family prenyltransferase [Bacteroidia bacterium]